MIAPVANALGSPIKMSSPPDWQLPTGVTRTLWDYAHSSEIARNYDDSIADSAWAKLDVAFALRHCPKPGSVIDLGCGTGRALIEFAKQGHRAVGVDLSERMLERCREKARAQNVDVTLIKGNIVELDWLDAASFDCAVCLFSTLGMIAGAEHRRRFVAQVHRILRPGGRFIVHAHNRWFNVWNPQGRTWLVRDLFRSLFLRRPGGDHAAPAHQGLAGLQLHLFTRREIVRLLRNAGFRVMELLPLGLKGPLRGIFQAFRAHGYLIAAERTSR